LRVEVVALAHDWLSPLRAGDVTIPGVDLAFDFQTPIERFVVDAPHDVGEMSLARTLLRWQRGDHRFVPVPVYVYRSFVHREYFVRRDSPLHSLGELAGRRVALAGWPNTGNTWARAVLREAGVPVEKVGWVASDEEDPDGDRLGLESPSYVSHSPLRPLELLLAGKVDAAVLGETPMEVRAADGRVRRLITDFPAVEKQYFLRTGIHPAHHIVGIRRELVEREPTIAHALYDALVEARRRWFERRIDLEETSPWLAADIDASMLLFGGSWYRDGATSEANRRMLGTLHAEQVAEGLARASFDPLSTFEEFEHSTAAARGK
jgi:4,5-dihydroxyphthalate decarboxylase